MPAKKLNHTQDTAIGESVHAKSKRGFIVLSIRSGMLHLFQVASILVLSKWLSPSDYGIFGVLQAWIGVLFYFMDFGISGALVRQEAEPTRSQLSTCFATQLSLSLIFFAGIYALAPLITQKSQLAPSNEILLELLAFSIPVYAFRCVPRILLDRHLKFDVLARVDVGEALAMYTCQIGLAIAGFGVWSMVIANMMRAVVGTILLFLLQPAFVAPYIVYKELKALLSFGIPFQLNAIIPALRGLILPLVLAPLLSVDGVGLVTWTISLASIPMILAYNYNQVFFPSLSRLQSSFDQMRGLASRASELALLVFGFLFTSAACSGFSLISLLFDKKWSEAKIIFPIAALSVGLSTIRYLASSIMNAAGLPKRRLWIETAAVVTEFGAVYLATVKYAVVGYFWATTVVNLIFLVATGLAIRSWLRKETLRRLAAVFTAGLFSYYLIHVTGAEHFIFIAVPAMISGFLGITYFLDRSSLADYLKLFSDLRATAKKAKLIS